MDASEVADESTCSGDECDVDMSLWGSDEEDIQDFQKEVMKYAIPNTTPELPVDLLLPSPPLVSNTAAGASEVVSKKIREPFDDQPEVNTLILTP
jgi:hypothetical protein